MGSGATPCQPGCGGRTCESRMSSSPPSPVSARCCCLAAVCTVPTTALISSSLCTGGAQEGQEWLVGRQNRGSWRQQRLGHVHQGSLGYLVLTWRPVGPPTCAGWTCSASAQLLYSTEPWGRSCVEQGVGGGAGGGGEMHRAKPAVHDPLTRSLQLQLEAPRYPCMPPHPTIHTNKHSRRTCCTQGCWNICAMPSRCAGLATRMRWIRSLQAGEMAGLSGNT